MSDLTSQKRSFTRLLLIVFLILLVVAPVVFFLMRYNKLNSELNRMRKEHEPVTIAHLQPKRIAGSGNAAYYINDEGFEEDFAKYHKAVFESQDGKESSDEGNQPDADSAAAFDKLEEQDPSIIRSIYAACKCEAWRPDVDLSKISASQWIQDASELNGNIRSIIQLLVWKMKVKIFQEDPNEAVNVGLRGMNLINHAAGFPSGLVGHLNVVATRAMILNEIKNIVENHDLETDTLVLIQSTLKKHEGPDHYVEALRSERAIGLDLMREQSSFQYNLTGITYLALMQEEISAAEEGRPVAEVPTTPLDSLVEQSKPTLEQVRQAEQRSQELVQEVLALVNEKMDK